MIDININREALASLGHSIDNPGQLASLPVVPVVVQQLGDGDGDEASQDPTQGLQNCLPLLGGF